MIQAFTSRAAAGDLPISSKSGHPASGEAWVWSGPDYLNRIGLDRIHRWDARHLPAAVERLQAIEGAEDSRPTPEQTTGFAGLLAAFSVEVCMPTRPLGHLLDASGICIRSGHHCTPPLPRHYGLAFHRARASLASPPPRGRSTVSPTNSKSSVAFFGRNTA